MSESILLRHLPQTLSRQEFNLAFLKTRIASEEEKSLSLSKRMKLLLAARKQGLLVCPRSEFYSWYFQIDALIRAGYALKDSRMTRGAQVYVDWPRMDWERDFQKILDRLLLDDDESFVLLTGIAGGGKSTFLRSIQELYPLLIDHSILSGGRTQLLQIPFLRVRCASRATPRAVANAFLDAVAKIVGSEFVAHIASGKSVDDMYFGISKLCRTLCIGVVIWDEFQDILQATIGRRQLLNLVLGAVALSGTPMVFSGTYHLFDLFSSDARASRRGAGGGDFRLHRISSPKETAWKSLCASLWAFQVVANESPLTDEIEEVLYRYSQGVPGFLSTLIQSAQKVAMLQGTETLDAETLKSAYEDQMGLLHAKVEALASGDPKLLALFPDLWHPALSSNGEARLNAALAKAEQNKGVFR